MLRRTFLKAALGALAAVYCPLSLLPERVAAEAPAAGTLRGTQSIIELVKERRAVAMDAMADQIEDHFWGISKDATPYWMVT